MIVRKLMPGRLVAATHNAGKVRELKDLFEPLGFEVVSAADLNLDEPDETEFTFEGNALIKARAACNSRPPRANKRVKSLAAKPCSPLPPPKPIGASPLAWRNSTHR